MSKNEESIRVFSPLNAGHYVYIETSAPRQPGDIAWLVSSTRPATSSGCINFWYNMKGQTIDTLTVYMKIPGKQDITPVCHNKVP